MGWEETAAALTDPERMAAHTGGFDPDDYVEVLRPEVDKGDDQSAVSAPGAGGVSAGRAYQPHLPVRRPGGRPAEEPGHRVLLHRKYKLAWDQ